MAQEVDSRIALRQSLRRQDDLPCGYSLAKCLAIALRQSLRRQDDSDGPLLHWEFQRRIPEIAGVDVRVRAVERVKVLRLLQGNWFSSPLWVDPVNAHTELVDAITSRDPVAADAAMRTHLRRALEKELFAYRTRHGNN